MDECKPLLDGSGLLIWSQLEELSPFYDVRCLAVPPADRSTYESLAVGPKQISTQFSRVLQMASNASRIETFRKTVRFAIQWYNMAIRPSISQELTNPKP